MGSNCLKVTKYFLFLFNLLFFSSVNMLQLAYNLNLPILACLTTSILSCSLVTVGARAALAAPAIWNSLSVSAGTPSLTLKILGAVILGFGLWILLDKISFISFLQTSSESLKVGAYILTGVGAITMLMGFLGCLGAVNEVRCLLGLYITFLLLILLAQVAAGLLIYFQRDAVKKEMSTMVHELIQDYDPNRQDKKNIQDAWDYVQRQLSCCGWISPENWTENVILRNLSFNSYPCSCSNGSVDSGFCEITNRTVSVADWPVHSKGCMNNVESWLQDNLGIILGVCTGVAVIELLGMVLAISLCKNIHREDYTKVPK